MAEEPYTPPPFGDEWKRVHTRIHPYLDRTSDWWRVKLTGRNDKVLLDFEISYRSRLAHRSFYKDFLVYLNDHLWSVDRSALSTREMDALYDNLLGYVSLCKAPVLSLPGHVVEELFKDVEKDEEERKRKEEEARQKKLANLDAQLRVLKKKRKALSS
ncbi:MAG: hypothetical protein CMB11_04755 [Euryarchaeota archaeon]|nr:hypothetical protein [Euryarchaeota archaeon]|tara:strand:- start:5174 stop:5647 length:474 start_codon:yes stop_codon:yes gene_type:complete